jgi:hypothetical protein
MSEMQWANEMAPNCIDGGRDWKSLIKGGIGATPTKAEESALGAAL